MSWLLLLNGLLTLASPTTSYVIHVDFPTVPVAGPVSMPCPAGTRSSTRPAGLLYAVLISGKLIRAQLDDQNRLWWWNTAASPGPSTAPAREAPQVEVTPADGLINITIDGQPFTKFNFSPSDPKPYLYPVVGPTGAPLTRDYPMKDTEAERKAKRQDHPHQRSIWTAYGDVRTRDLSKPGTDYWAQGPGKGVQKLRRISRTVSGPVFGQLEAEVDWLAPDGRRELSDTRTYTFFRGDPDTRIIDVQIVFHFDDGDVMFADTKEGGTIALRTATWLDELGGGHMVNSAGQRGMKPCWGQPAEWCDYVGTLNNRMLGIAVLDAPTNPRHPVRWHIRDYGLFAANPFTLRAFTGNKSDQGGMSFKKGGRASFNYRILLHAGDTAQAHIAEHYRLFAHPPKVRAHDR